MMFGYQNKRPEKNPDIEPLKPVKPTIPEPEIVPAPDPNKPEKIPGPEIKPGVTPEITPGKTDLQLTILQ
jgi:hypothetical protein